MANLTDLTYETHIARMRSLIDTYGAENAINALVLAFDAESEDRSNTYSSRNYYAKVSYEVSKIFEGLKKL